MRNIKVVLNQVSLSDPPFRPEEFVEVCELHYAAVHFDFQIFFVLRKLYPRDVRSSFTSGVFASTDYGRMIFASRNLDHFRLKISDLSRQTSPFTLTIHLTFHFNYCACVPRVEIFNIFNLKSAQSPSPPLASHSTALDDVRDAWLDPTGRAIAPLTTEVMTDGFDGRALRAQ